MTSHFHDIPFSSIAVIGAGTMAVQSPHKLLMLALMYYCLICRMMMPNMLTGAAWKPWNG